MGSTFLFLLNIYRKYVITLLLLLSVIFIVYIAWWQTKNCIENAQGTTSRSHCTILSSYYFVWCTVQATSVLTKASVWYEIRVLWASKLHVRSHSMALTFTLIFLQPLDLQERTVPHLKDLIHTCLEIKAQGLCMTLNVNHVGLNYPYFISYRGLC